MATCTERTGITIDPHMSERPPPLPDHLVPLRDALVAAHREHRPVPVAGLPEPSDDAGAYAVQQAVADALGWFRSETPRAWKVGAPSHNATPSSAPLPPSVVHSSPARFAPGTFNRILIEGEIAFRLRAPLAGNITQHDVGAITTSIGELVVTIEVVDPRYTVMDDASPRLRLADQLLHGALVVGSGVAWRTPPDWASIVAIVRRDGEVVKETRGGHPLGDLRYLLGWLARHAAQSGVPLAAGSLITAGTWTGVFEARPGETIDVEFPAIGRATARFD